MSTLAGEIRLNPLPGGGMVIIYTNITGRKRYEDVLTAARDQVEAARTVLRAVRMLTGTTEVIE